MAPARPVRVVRQVRMVSAVPAGSAPKTNKEAASQHHHPAPNQDIRRMVSVWSSSVLKTSTRSMKLERGCSQNHAGIS
eukprot:529116-Prymnesium_polylepis.1